VNGLTDYHAKYFAYELTKRCASDSPERLAGALVDAQVDLNPHQVEAALFAFRSPLSRGALLADEVGLGKTIEAGLVLSQRWADSGLRRNDGGSNRGDEVALDVTKWRRFGFRDRRQLSGNSG
jgi:SNF2 family DNA or RNA helicase